MMKEDGHRQIDLGFHIQDIMKSHSNFKMLENVQFLKCALLYDGKYLYEYNYQTMVENSRFNLLDMNETKLAINAAYCKKFEVYLMLCEGWKLYVFRRNLQLLQTVHFDSKYSVGFYYIDRYDQLLLIGVDVIDMVWLEIKTNIKQAKYLSNISFDMKRSEVKKKQTFEEGLDWNKGFYIVESELHEDNLLYIWGLKDLKVLNLFTGKCKYSFLGIGKKDNIIYCFLLLQKFRYFVIGYQNGSIRVWKLTEGKRIIHTYEGHTRPIESLMLHQDPRFFCSSSGDQTIRLWNLDQFTNVYTFSLPGIYHAVTLLSHDRFMAEHENMICLGTTNHSKQLILTHGAKVLAGSKQMTDSYENRSLILTLDNNSGICVWSDSFALESDEYTKVPVGVFYPPPKSKGIVQILPSPYDFDEFLLLLENGDISVSRMERGTGVMVSIQKSETILDFEGHATGQTASLIKFINIDAPLYDVDFGRQQDGKSKLKLNQTSITSTEENKLFAMGLSKGSIVFVSLKNLTIIYTRISFHRDKILALDGLKYNKGDQKCSLLISLCVEGHLKLITFKDGNAECIKSYQSNKSLCSVITFNNKAVVQCYRGQFQVFKLFKRSNLLCYSNDDGNEHESQIISVDVQYQRKLIITSCQDKRIKIWTMRKVLLLQLNVDDPIQGAWFINHNADIIVAHDGKLSVVTHKSTKILNFDVKKTNQNFKSQRLQGLTFDEYFSQVHLNYQKQLHVTFIESKKDIIYEQMVPSSPIHQKSTKKVFQISPEITYQKKPSILNYVGGKIILPTIDKDGKQTILIRGTEQELENLEQQQPQLSQKRRSRSQAIKKESSSKLSNTGSNHFVKLKSEKRRSQNDWEALQSFEKNKKDRSMVISALPKLPGAQDLDLSMQMERSLHRKILTRRDITLNRIFMQRILKTSEPQNEFYNSSQYFK